MANSKDQAARLYDLRKMRSYGDFVDEPNASQKYGAAGFDCEFLCIRMMNALC